MLITHAHSPLFILVSKHQRERTRKTIGRTHQQHRHPPIQPHLVQHGEAVGLRDHIQQHRRSDRSLVREQLHAVHAEFHVIHSHSNRINGTANDTAECEQHAKKGCLVTTVAPVGQRVEVRSHSYPDADRNESIDGRSRQHLLVHGEFHCGDRSREKDAADSVEGNAGGEGEILQDDVETHRAG